jgi:hypothetical protein
MGPQVLQYLIGANDALTSVDLASITPLTVGMRNRLVSTSGIVQPEKVKKCNILMLKNVLLKTTLYCIICI